MKAIWIKDQVTANELADGKKEYITAFELWFIQQKGPLGITAEFKYSPDFASCVTKIVCKDDFLVSSLPAGCAVYLTYSDTDNLDAKLIKTQVSDLKLSFPDAVLEDKDSLKTLIEKIVQTTEETDGYKEWQ